MKEPKGKSGIQPGRNDGETRIGATRAVSALIGPLTKRALGKHGFASASLISDWATVVGAELAASCHPLKLAFPPGKRDGGTLHLRVSGGAALEIQHVTPQLIERINGHLGYPAVARLKLEQGPVARGSAPRRPRPAPAPKPMPARHWDGMDEITDPALRESLERLGAAVAARESRTKK
ncbi:MAG: DciA family protein [Gammaproteobacteria bacterium]|jgi:hypothetical protein